MHTLVVGLGNPILGDDGAGWRIAEEIASRLSLPVGCASDHAMQVNREEQSVTIECLSLGGLSLMEHLIGYDRAILIDTIVTGQHPTGSLYCIPLEEVPNSGTGHLSSTHDTTLPSALKVGRSIGATLPEEITVVAVEACIVYDFSEELSPPIVEAVPIAVSIVMELLK